MVTLRNGEFEAILHPDAGMVCSSLRHRGDEILGQRGGLDAYRERGSSFGIPLLAPWANRLSDLRYRAGDDEVVLEPALSPLKLDENGLPIHGLLTASPLWEVTEHTTSRVHAQLDFGQQPGLLAAFPFPHLIEVDAILELGGISIETIIRPTGVVAVPLAFGWHPYLTVPGVPREEWDVVLPVLEQALLDERGIPTGDTRPAGDLTGPLGERTFDDLFTRVAERAAFAVQGGDRRIELTFGPGYPAAQIFAPAGEDFICFEPMAAPTNALLSGDGLRRVEPGSFFSARFSIAVKAL